MVGDSQRYSSTVLKHNSKVLFLNWSISNCQCFYFDSTCSPEPIFLCLWKIGLYPADSMPGSALSWVVCDEFQVGQLNRCHLFSLYPRSFTRLCITVTHSHMHSETNIVLFPPLYLCLFYSDYIITKHALTTSAL